MPVSSAASTTPSEAPSLAKMDYEIQRLQVTVDLMQRELVQVRAQVDVLNARCATTTQAAPAQRKKYKSRKAIRTNARHVTLPTIRAQRAAGQEERVLGAREAETPYRKAVDLPHRSVLVDGYISGCHGPSEAERYFKCLLKSNTISASHHSEGQGDSFAVTSVPQHIRSRLPNQSAWVLDRRVTDTGSVVRQAYHLEEAELQMPIFFLHTDGRLGLPLEAAVAGHCYSLVNAQSSAPLGDQTTTHIRIAWPGYVQFRRQVQIRYETHQRNLISVSKFAQHIGRSVEAFLEVRQLNTRKPVPRWFIGERGIQRDEIVIIGAINVSSGSWMPILQLDRYIS